MVLQPVHRSVDRGVGSPCLPAAAGESCIVHLSNTHGRIVPPKMTAFFRLAPEKPV